MVYGLPEALGVEQVLARAREQEEEYNWRGAAESYKTAIGLLSPEESSKMGDVYERSGYAFHKAAMQAETVDEFRERTHHAITNYGKAAEFYERANHTVGTGKKLRCDAMISYLSFWLGSEPTGRKRLVDECWVLTKKALKAFGESGDTDECWKTYDQLSISAMFGFALEWNYQARENIAREAVEFAERAMTFLSSISGPDELAKAYVKIATHLHGFGFYITDPEKSEGHSRKALEYWMKASELSEEAALIELPHFLLAAPESLGGGTGTETALTSFSKALAYAKKTMERFIVGGALDWLAYHTFWKAVGTEDPDERLELDRKALRYAQEANHQYSSILFQSPRNDALWIGAPYPEHYWQLAFFETDLAEKKELLRRALEAAPELLKQAEDSGYPDVVSYSHHVFSKILGSLAKTEAEAERKRKLLEEALEHRKKTIIMLKEVEPTGYYSLGVMQNYLADIKFELCSLAADAQGKRTMLLEAVRDKETAVRFCTQQMPFYERIGALHLFAGLGEWQYQYGDSLNRLCELTGDRRILQQAAEAFRGGAKSFDKLNLASRMAECYWKAAQAYDAFEEHLKAAENFVMASNNYRVAAEKIPELKAFYQDHAFYMGAWSEIEKAKYRHGRQEYGAAKGFYERAAALHKSTKEWSFLTPNYFALAQVENGEDLSRKEQGQEAIQAFQQAAELFSETKTSLQAELNKIENMEKKQLVTSLVKGADLRREYCMGRVALEEAKLLDRKGDHSSSSERYGQATEIFERITLVSDSEQDRKELSLIATLSRAWQTMTRAEVEASPSLYLEASKLFEEAKDLASACGSLPEIQMLTLGHSRFCKALEAGTRFADTREEAMHTVATQHLKSAANYYLKAGLQNASEYTEAMELLFDAYGHMDQAKKEKDHEKKAKLYAMTEKVLQASAESFLKAQHPAKKEQVIRLMEKVKKEKELAVSLTEVLHAPAFVSATTAFSVPAATRESAVGLERFEHADVQASVITRQKHLKVGEDLNLEIELVNAGKGPAQLVKMEELIPEGFELTEKPEPYRVEDSYLNMKGKRLDPLKTEEVKLVLRPKVQGQFTLKPRILYLDESGKYKSHEPESIEVTVKELGISGWVKGR